MDSKVLQKTKSLLSGLFATHCRAADDSSAWPRGTAIIDRTTMHDSKCHKEAGIACTKSRKTKGTKASNFVAFCDFEDPYVTSTNYTESPQPPRGQSATTQSFFPIHRCKAAVSSAMHRGAAVGARTPVS